MRVRLRMGDCVSVMGNMAESSVDVILCDPPYGIEFMGKEWDSLGAKAGKIIEDPVKVGGFQTSVGGNPYSRSRIRYGTDPAIIQEWHINWLTAAFRVLTPWGQLLAFSSPRTYHRLAAAMRAVGFEGLEIKARGYAEGFPKSLNISKALDKMLGVWDGWGTALKPAWEPVLVGRKPA